MFRLLAFVAMTGLVQLSVLAADVLIDCDANAIPPGALLKWENKGRLGGVFEAKQAPSVASVEGRSAVVFKGEESLSSSFVLPELQAFSVEAWVLNPTIERLETMLYVSPPKGGMGMEFNYSKSSNGGAFRSGFKMTTAFDSVPQPGAWHHLVWTYSGNPARSLKIYVDGELETASPFSLLIANQSHVLLGCAAEAKILKQAFSGALSRIRVFNSALSQDDVRREGKWSSAFAPSPKNGSTTDSLSATLKWERGSAEATAYNVYFGTDMAAVEKGDASALKEQFSAERNTAGPYPLTLGAAHYWRIDELDKGGKIVAAGKVWRLNADPGLANAPQPRDQNSNVKVSANVLAWHPGKYATKQHLYFGTNSAEVDRSGGTKLDLDAGVGQTQIPGGALQAGTRYYWKVDCDNGAQPASKGAVWTFRTQDEHIQNDVTFFVTSDTHYGRENNAELNRLTIGMMNALPGTALPANVGGGMVRTPQGVVLNGDLLDEGFNPATAPGLWLEFCRDYGLSGDDGRLCFPVYEGFGNHDGGPNKSISRAGIKERNKTRVGLTAVSDNGLHYSWDWDNLHLVQLNLFGGIGPEDVHGVNQAEHDPADAFGFLKQDLEKNVSKSAKQVITFQHFSYLGGMADWWTPVSKNRLYELLKQYDVPCLINGHSHGASFVPWNEFLTIHDGAAARPDSGNGDFLVVRVTAKELIVAQRTRTGWGISMRKSLQK